MVLYNIPSRVVINMPPAFLSELSSIDNVVAVKQANDDELGPIEGMAVLAGNDNVFLRTLEFGGAGGILVASHLVGPQMREMWDAAQGGDMERAREIDAGLQTALRGARRHHQPDPAQGGAGDARPGLGAHAAAAGPGRRRAASGGADGARRRRRLAAL